MEYFSTEDFGRVFFLRLDPGDYVLEGIIDLAKKENIRDGVIISAIGTLDECRLHMVTTIDYPVVEHFKNWKNKPLELTAITGIIADGKPHLHAVVGDTEKAYAGHLHEGCRVLYIAEIVILELKSAFLTRVLNENKHLELARKSS